MWNYTMTWDSKIKELNFEDNFERICATIMVVVNH